MTIPTLIVIAGPPCAGKSALAAFLAERLSMPAAGKDSFKEILFDTLGTADRDWSRRLGEASIELLYRFAESNLTAGISCIIESNFRARQDAPRLLEMRRHHLFLPIAINCVADGPILTARFRERATSGERHPGHCDRLEDTAVMEEVMSGRNEPLDLGGESLEVDTTSFARADFEAVARTITRVRMRQHALCRQREHIETP